MRTRVRNTICRCTLPVCCMFMCVQFSSNGDLHYKTASTRGTYTCNSLLIVVRAARKQPDPTRPCLCSLSCPRPFPSFPPPYPPPLLSKFPSPKLNPAREERCKLPQRGPGQSPGRKRIFMHLGLSERIPWQHFKSFMCSANNRFPLICQVNNHPPPSLTSHNFFQEAWSLLLLLYYY